MKRYNKEVEKHNFLRLAYRFIGNDYRDEMFSKLYLTVIGIIMQNLKYS